MDAIKAAIDVVNVCIQHAAFLAGRGEISDMIEDMAKGNLYMNEAVTTACVRSVTSL